MQLIIMMIMKKDMNNKGKVTQNKWLYNLHENVDACNKNKQTRER